MVMMGGLNEPALASDTINGAKIFNVNCAGCHLNGGNIVRRNKTLKTKALQRNKMDSLEAIQAIVTNGKNNMSAYGDRLTKQEIEDVAAYVLEQARNNWKK
jgi:cytochrome c6